MTEDRCPECGLPIGDRHECVRDLSSGMITYQKSETPEFVFTQTNKRYGFTPPTDGSVPMQ